MSDWPSILALFLVPFLGAGTFLVFGLRRARRLERNVARWLGAVASCLSGAVLFVALLIASAGLQDRGSWMCSVCCALEERHSSFGVTYWWGEPEEPERSVAIARDYCAWFARVAPAPHVHAWVPVGCHWRGRGVYCSPSVEDGLFYASLPRVPDDAIALRLVQVLARADPDSRTELLRDFNRGAPFEALATGAQPSREELDAEYAAWLADHPLWRAAGG